MFSLLTHVFHMNLSHVRVHTVLVKISPIKELIFKIGNYIPDWRDFPGPASACSTIFFLSCGAGVFGKNIKHEKDQLLKEHYSSWQCFYQQCVFFVW